MVSIRDVGGSVPGLPEPFIPRLRLLEALDDGDGDRELLLCAPLPAHWARSTEAAGTAVAWADAHRAGDPGRFWPTVLTALAPCPVVPSDSALLELGRSAPASWATSRFTTDVVESLDALPARITLVLHDVPE